MVVVGGEIDRGTLRDDPCRIDRRVTGVVVPLDLIEVDGIGDARDLVQLAQIVPQIWIVDDAPQIALEVTVVNRVEADEGGEQAPISFGHARSSQVASMRKALFEIVEG